MRENDGTLLGPPDMSEPPDPPRPQPPNGRVTNRDLLDIWRWVGDRLDTQNDRLNRMMGHFDENLNGLRTEMRDLRTATNECLHEFDKRLRPIERGWDIRVALLRGSWKLTTIMITLTSVITGVIAKFGFPWEWGIFC